MCDGECRVLGRGSHHVVVSRFNWDCRVGDWFFLIWLFSPLVWQQRVPIWRMRNLMPQQSPAAVAAARRPPVSYRPILRHRRRRRSSPVLQRNRFNSLCNPRPKPLGAAAEATLPLHCSSDERPFTLQSASVKKWPSSRTTRLPKTLKVRWAKRAERIRSRSSMPSSVCWWPFVFFFLFPAWKAQSLTTIRHNRKRVEGIQIYKGQLRSQHHIIRPCQKWTTWFDFLLPFFFPGQITSTLLPTNASNSCGFIFIFLNINKPRPSIVIVVSKVV